MKYIKQLDSIRTFAVMLVVMSHWFMASLESIFPFGNLGVNIFFVLSGFLITRILLTEKAEIEGSTVHKSKLLSIGRFMMRRSLRIFPIYYLVLLGLYFGDSYIATSMPEDWKYYVLYVQNFLFYFRQSWPGKLSPFWSLAVEEQFYLIWPWLLFFVNRKHIKKVIIIGIIVGTLSSLLFPFIPGKADLTPILTLCCLQSFCLGGLLSYWITEDKGEIVKNYSLLKKIATMSFLLYLNIKLFCPDIAYFDRLFESIITSWIIASILLNKANRFDFILSNKVLISIGKVSYGIYLFHNFIPPMVKAILHFLKKFTAENSETYLALEFLRNDNFTFYTLSFSALLGLAYFSFYFIESPFLRLKKYF
jgi:peptidoglycan/LPS O-acetylase OafA/YrhL